MSSSLYSAPIMSSLSRDPSGIDPDGVDESNRLDPAGVHLESMALAKKAEKMQKAAERLKNLDVATIRAAGSLKNLDVATLVGAPPPPPKTPPPKKNHRRTGSRSKTPQPVGVDIKLSDENADFDVENVVSGITSEIDYVSDNHATSNAQQVLALPSFEEPKSDSMDVDDPAAEVIQASAGDTQQKISVTPKDVNTRLSIADERRRSALAMYQSNDLVLDQEEAMLAEQLLRPAMKTIDNKANISVEKNGVATPLSQTSQKMALSPSSQSTRPHSNQTHAPAEENRYEPVREPTIREAPAYEHSARDPSPRESPRTQSRFQQDSPVAASPSRNERRKRGVSTERHAKPDPKIEKAKEEKSKKDKKRGFFKKLFRGKGKEQGSVGSSSKASAEESLSSRRKADPPMPQHQTKAAASPVHSKTRAPSPNNQRIISPKANNVAPVKADPVQAPKPALKSVLKSESDRNYQGPPIDDAASEEYSQPMPTPRQTATATDVRKVPSVDSSSFQGSATMPAASPVDGGYELSTQAYSEEEFSTFSTKTPKNLSQDPPDDEHGDPPVRSGPPLLSPTSYFSHLSVSTSQEEEEQSRIESVRSRLAEVYEDHTHEEQEQAIQEQIMNVPSSLSQDRRDFIFNQNDEVSILSGPSIESLQKKSKSFDPVQAAESMHSEPEGQYETRGKRAEPYVAPLFHASGPQATPAHLSHLRVHVSGPNQDPAGESPMHTNSARGVSHSAFGDPVGESPVAWKVSNPLNDPVGESPLHAKSPVVSTADPDASTPTVARNAGTPQFQKPPQPRHADELLPDSSMDIGAGYISDDSTFPGVEEKKEDDRRIDDSPFDERAAQPTKEIVEQKGAQDKETEATDSEVQETEQTNSTSTEHKASSAVEASLATLEPEASTEKTPAKVSEPEPRQFSRKKINMSKATRAALRLSKVTGKNAIKAQLDEIPTPTNHGASPSNLVGSVPLLASGATQVESKEVVPAGKVPPRHDARERNTEESTTVEKSGFKSAPTTPAAAKKSDSLTVSTAAYTNAKAVAYLHRLHGEPSPRHSWHSAKKKKPEPSPVARHQKARRERKKKREKANQKVQRQAPSPSEYGAHNYSEMALTIDVNQAVQVPEEDGETTPKRAHLTPLRAPSPEKRLAPMRAPSPERLRRSIQNGGPDKVFAAYNSKFHGRKPSKKKAPTPETLASPKSLAAARAASAKKESEKKKPPPILIPGAISTKAVKRGILLRRKKRKDDIQSGRSTPVILTPKQKPTGRNRFNFVPANEAEIKDPIQRAGRRLLSKAAIPIQCAARRYIAKREAVDRMWALIEIQTYFRRWRCEANLQASVESAKTLQTCARGWLARKLVKDMQHSATQIQKIVRGYLAAAHVYDTIYYVVRIQAAVRGYQRRKMNIQRDIAATTIQKNYRGHWSRVFQEASLRLVSFQALCRGYMARQRFARAKTSVSLIQAAWRSYSARLSFQFEIVDIIIVQTIARRWAACRQVERLKAAKLSAVAEIIQAYTRGHITRVLYKKNLAATKIQARWRGQFSRESRIKNAAAQKIQATWRGFQCYTDYIFAIVDILVVQRTMRQWLARRKVRSLKQNNAATVLQAQWRRHRAQKTLLYSMVHIIIAQSIARRFLVRGKLAQVRNETERQLQAATKIQAAWRGFWDFSHYIIVQYEIVKIQSLVRGVQARQKSSLKLGCAIIMQATARQYIAKKTADSIVERNTVVAAAAQELRERNACRRIQFWWRIVLDWTREKKAALTIERFFIHVRAEVDREIKELERKKSEKKEKRKKGKKKDADDKLLEKAWLNTVPSQTRSDKGVRRQSTPQAKGPGDTQSASAAQQGYAPHRTPTMTVKKFPSPMGSACWAPIQQTDSTTTYTSLPTDTVRMNPSADFSEVSNITNPSTFMNTGTRPSQHAKQMRTGGVMCNVEEASLEETMSYKNNGGGESRKSREKRMTTEDYIKKYGPKSVPNRMPSNGGQQRHFFSEDGASTASRKANKMPSNASSTGSHGHGVPTPRSTRSAGGASKVVLTPKGFHHNQYPPSTPRSASGNSVPSTPRSHGMHHGAPSPRSHGMHHGAPSPRLPSGSRQSSYPPVTPNSRHKKLSRNGSITRRETAETESQTTYSQSQATYTRQSPGGGSYEGHHRIAGAPVMVMKSIPNFTQSYSVEEAHEMLYLGDDYGEV